MEETKGSSYLLRSNMQPLLDLLLPQLMDFTMNQHYKIKSLGALQLLIRACKNDIAPYAEKILFALYKHVDSDEMDGQVCITLLETAKELGLNVNQAVLIPILVRHIGDVDLKNSMQVLGNRLQVLGAVMDKLSNIDNENVKLLLNILYDLDLFNANDSAFKFVALNSYFCILQGIIINLQFEVKQFHRELFLPLLVLQSMPESRHIHEKVIEVMGQLSKYCGFATLIDLYSFELAELLEIFNGQFKTWRSNSPDRFAFDTLVRYGGTALIEHWEQILTIIAGCVETDRDIEIRIDMLILVEHLLENPETALQVTYLAEFIAKGVLIPATAWKANMPNYKVRKAALVCLAKMCHNKILSPELGVSIFSEVLTAINSTIDDERDPHLRFLSVILLSKLTLLCKDLLNEENLMALYPLLIQRLDDSQDKIRLEICEIFVYFFQVCAKVRLPESTFEYIVKIVLIHLDDPSQVIRDQIYKVLQAAAFTPSKNLLVKLASEAIQKFTHASYCKSIINFAESL